MSAEKPRIEGLQGLQEITLKVSALTGADYDTLDGQPTVGVRTPRLYKVLLLLGSQIYHYLLRPKTDADEVDGELIIKPDDSDTLVFERVSDSAVMAALTAETEAREEALQDKADLVDGKHVLSQIPGWEPIGSFFDPAQTSVTLEAGGKYVIGVDSENALEILLPSSPADGDVIEAYSFYDDGAGAYELDAIGYLRTGMLYRWLCVDGGWNVSLRPWNDEVRGISGGGTGATTAANARTNLGLANSYSSTTISAAGNTTVSAWSNSRRGSRRLTVTAGSGAYTHTVSLSTTSAIADDRAEIDVIMPASANPTIEIRNASSGGTLLATIPTDAAVARTWRVICQYNGTAWQLVALQPKDTEERLQAYVDPVANGRAARQAMRISQDGGVTYASTVSVPAFGTGPYTVSAWFRAESFGPPNNAYLFLTVSGFGFYVANDGSGFGIEAAGAYLSYALSAGRWYHLAAVRSSTATGGVSYYVDGRLVGTATDATNYASGIASIGNGVTAFSYEMAQPVITNYAMPAADVARLVSLGTLSPYDAAAPLAGTQILTGDNSTFATGTGNWLAIGSAGSVTWDSTNQAADITFGVSQNDGVVLGPTYFDNPPKIKWGKRYRLEVDVISYTGAPRVHFSRTDANLAVTSAIIPVTSTGTLTAEVVVLDASQVEPSQQSAVWIAGNGTAGTIKVGAIRLVACGALLALDPQWDGHGAYWPDMSGNGAHITLGSGVLPIIKQVRGASYTTPTTNVSDFSTCAPVAVFQVAGGQVFTAGQVLAEWEPDGLFDPIGGLFHFQCDRGSSLKYASAFVGVASNTEIATTNTSSADGMNLDVVVVAGDWPSGIKPKVQVKVRQSVTIESSDTFRLYLISGTMPRSAIK